MLPLFAKLATAMLGGGGAVMISSPVSKRDFLNEQNMGIVIPKYLLAQTRITFC